MRVELRYRLFAMTRFSSLSNNRKTLGNALGGILGVVPAMLSAASLVSKSSRISCSEQALGLFARASFASIGAGECRVDHCLWDRATVNIAGLGVTGAILRA